MKTKFNNKLKNLNLFSKGFLLIYTLISAIPLYYVLINAFKINRYITNSPIRFPNLESFTFGNILRSWESLKYLQSLFNTLFVVVISCLLLIVVGSLAGYAISIVNSRGYRLFYFIAILLITVPFQVIMVPLVINLNHIGLLNSYFGTSMIFVGIMLPVVIFLYTGFMRSLPKELCEAAVVDGAGMFRVYLQIYFPLMKTITGTVLIIKGTSIWNDFLIPLITISDSDKTPLIVRLYSFASVRFNSWELLFGSTFLSAMPLIVMFLFLQKSFIRGVVAGAVKG